MYTNSSESNKLLTPVLYLTSFVYLLFGVVQVSVSVFTMASSVLTGFSAIGLTSLLVSTSFIPTKLIMLLPPSLAAVPILLTGLFNLVIAYGLRKRKMYGLVLCIVSFALYLILPILVYGFLGLGFFINPVNLAQAGIVVYLLVNKKHFN